MSPMHGHPRFALLREVLNLLEQLRMIDPAASVRGEDGRELDLDEVASFSIAALSSLRDQVRRAIQMAARADRRASASARSTHRGPRFVVEDPLCRPGLTSPYSGMDIADRSG